MEATNFKKIHRPHRMRFRLQIIPNISTPKNPDIVADKPIYTLVVQTPSVVPVTQISSSPVGIAETYTIGCF
jgi:hypothetical protein